MTEPTEIMRATERRVAALIEASSLGTAGARRLRQRVSPETSSQVVAEAALMPADGPLPFSGGFFDIEPLIPLAIAGDRAALDRVVHVVEVFGTRYCRAKLGTGSSEHDAADTAARDVVRQTLKALPMYTDQGRPFLAFLYGIAQHRVRWPKRRGRNDPRPTRKDRDATSVDGLLDQDLVVMLRSLGDAGETRDQELYGRLLALLDTLTDKQREILTLRVPVGLTTEQTADAVGSSPGAVRVAQHRALARMTRQLSAWSRGE
ncbi:RNA polymerase subunit sigma-70 [Amycolatopsis sp. NBC_00348]|uniref:sigma factor-like helix-turn-helix DNA-binding protein n=1 Tax=Amycolatopsis sp. NBC_00348 TaxID=2975956 RepID=UPI002E271C13